MSNAYSICIRCARCNQPVQYAIMGRDHAKHGYVFMVMCHGEWEECFVGDAFVNEHGPLTEGVAFERTAIEGRA